MMKLKMNTIRYIISLTK